MQKTRNSKRCCPIAGPRLIQRRFSITASMNHVPKPSVHALAEHIAALAANERLVPAQPEIASQQFFLKSTSSVYCLIAATLTRTHRVTKSPRPMHPRAAAATMDGTDAYVFLEYMEHTQEAEEHYRTSLDLQGQLAAEFGDIPEYRVTSAGSHTNLAILFRKTDRTQEAEELQREAVDIRRKLVADSPAVPAEDYTNLGVACRNRRATIRANNAAS